MLSFHVFAGTHPRWSLDSFLGLTPIPFPLSPKSHAIMSFADPHLLNSVISYRYKIIGGRGTSTFQYSSSSYPLFHHSPKPFKMNTCKSVSKQSTLTPFRINTYEKQGKRALFAQFWCNVSPFRINTCKSVSKQRTLTTFRMNTYEKQGGGGCYC